jgi:molybdopterin converting factor small subunit
VTVRLYGAARVALRCREHELDLPEGATVAHLVEEFIRQAGPVAREYLLDAQGRGYAVVFAVDGESAPPETALREGSHVALMPATAGGTAP